MHICSLASSSSGNCIYIGDDNTHILIDVGISGKKIAEGLSFINISPKDLNGILITHEHADHIKSLGIMARRFSIPIFATQTTWNELQTNSVLGKIDPSLHVEIIPDVGFQINDIDIYPFKTSHDAVDPVCYTFTKNNKKISVATDLGCYNDYIKEKLMHSNVLFIEANHDIKMLEVGKYPYFLKQRILSDFGHLSNEMSGKLISELIHKDLTHVILGHLSQENNYPDIAFESVKLELYEREAVYSPTISVLVAKRNQNSDLIVI
ncbi:MAG: ribonuclease Z [Firmicutes bacterium HGW-Firmicutes-1]|jgi:phosphoribosyl 1,2-cyclic phosphodiesterase|nr:MAG: ribonuclease Z [Firmicutes bacterium HGW-Firmicutes-1]